MTNQLRSLVIGCSMLALAACQGADDVVAPGGPIILPTPTPTATPTPTPTGGSVTAAAACTPGTQDAGTIVLQNNRGSIRNCRVPSIVTGTLTLSGRRADGIMYSMDGRTEVGRDVSLAANGAAGAATLNVLPGVTVFANSRETALIVNRGSRLNADGQATAPIIFTALENLTGQGLTEDINNLWGGLIINGRAPISDCDVAFSTSSVGGDAGCWRNAEGLSSPALFGGNLPNDSSGIIRFVQVNFTGVGVNANEIQGITTGGVGSGTVMSNIQIHNSLDDGIESFGGTQNMDHLIMTGIADDSLDTDFGYRGSVQFVLAVRRAGGRLGDTATNQTILEVDSSSSTANDAQPRQYLRLANFTFVQNTPGEPVMRIRGGADVDLMNGIVVARQGGSQGCVDIDDSQTVQAAGTDERGPPRLTSVVFDCATLADADADVFEETTLSNSVNTGVNRTFTNMLTFLTGSTVGSVAPGTAELAVTAATLTAPMTQVNYIGAFSGPGDTWTQGWTCNSDVVNLRGATACTDIRVS